MTMRFLRRVRHFFSRLLTRFFSFASLCLLFVLHLFGWDDRGH